ncbi:hypothetical protein M409DRAFT_60729 [Zasmidium cellare ATCC 36951]|uniref:Uncharacterized protein n=1 Tax=Zasmidium cellare ATCC 36951 TaxID=1080233 RepID=A0A6A6BY40_ZASCE|nr:uncharacterized protein M409DRAFT_60729 [Zasmidium cellare ATCC 36951]KAF2159513.1 hypothetical protein M409DRAFT_60729 [Zasmidium cellare ATCC 36951]
MPMHRSGFEQQHNRRALDERRSLPGTLLLNSVQENQARVSPQLSKDHDIIDPGPWLRERGCCSGSVIRGKSANRTLPPQEPIEAPKVHFTNLALIGLVAPGIAAPLGVRNGDDSTVGKLPQGFNNVGWGVVTCFGSIGCGGDPLKREALSPVGDDQSLCDAIGGCDGNLETPNKRSPLVIDVDELPHLSPGEIIGIGPQVEEEKREAQFAEACVMPYGCNGDPNDAPADFPDLGRLAADEKRSPSDTVSVNPDDLVHLDPDEICGFKGCGGVVGVGPEVGEEEKRDAALYELCVMPYGCNGDPNDGPADFGLNA